MSVSGAMRWVRLWMWRGPRDSDSVGRTKNSRWSRTDVCKSRLLPNDAGIWDFFWILPHHRTPVPPTRLVWTSVKLPWERWRSSWRRRNSESRLLRVREEQGQVNIRHTSHQICEGNLSSSAVARGYAVHKLGWLSWQHTAEFYIYTLNVFFQF